MLRSILTVFTLPMLLLLGSSSNNSAARPKQKSTDIQTETVEKLIVASGSVTVDIDLNRLNDAATPTDESNSATLRFALNPDSFFTIIVTNDVLRGPLPGSMGGVQEEDDGILLVALVIGRDMKTTYLASPLCSCGPCGRSPFSCRGDGDAGGRVNTGDTVSRFMVIPHWVVPIPLTPAVYGSNRHPSTRAAINEEEQNYLVRVL